MAIGTSNYSYGLGTPGTQWTQVDVQDIILNLSPKDTPFFEMTGTGSAQSIRHEWQVEALEARGINAFLEGADFTFTNMGTPTREFNIAQIITHGCEISGSAEAQPYYGARSAMKKELAKRMAEHRNALEHNLIRATITTGGSTAARRMDGLLAAANLATSGGLASLTEAGFISLAETLWQNGSEPNTVLTNSKLKNDINAFTGIGSTKYIETNIREVITQVLTYSSDYGTINVYLSRDMTGGAVNASIGQELAMFDKTLLRKDYLRPSFMKKYPEGIVDGHRTSLTSELTLYYGNGSSIYWWRGAAD